MIRLLARWRVTLGFVFTAIVLWLATPTPRSLVIGVDNRAEALSDFSAATSSTS